ncbi:hypothetical protein PoB_002027300 [Plakobranchus ocellatus]|uniref:Uncharacterized protein n=1 Tax=Plakobranchus ocellatus TaxID=259542 RepID=A0AAV3ZG47_9GAST|nr:hypothetical protein PoB_002027300 [Plakobranchus ocellatus]
METATKHAAEIHGRSSPSSLVHKLSTDPNRKKNHKSYKKPHEISYPPYQSSTKQISSGQTVSGEMPPVNDVRRRGTSRQCVDPKHRPEKGPKRYMCT